MHTVTTEPGIRRKPKMARKIKVKAPPLLHGDRHCDECGRTIRWEGALCFACAKVSREQYSERRKR